MEIPSTIYIGAGAIIAAIITGVISFINLIGAKDQKTSEFRQQWIDELRSDVSEYLARVMSISTKAELYKQIHAGKPLTAKILSSFSSEISDDLSKSSRLYHSIELRLNKVDDKELLSKLSSIESLFDNTIKNLSDVKKVDSLIKATISDTQDLLKKEWKRVKRGEPSFYITKYASAVILIVSIVGLWAISNSYITVSINSLTNQSSTPAEKRGPDG
ncbi:hypothetical protein [Bacterioplanoides sp. SCSIO 12839]|uniref:hypothetical protein n=1 Tax=Bacterioplanoides sp. SCSIO 12839 TaxID=2829569 RepID=UPI002104396C|nr:hypothetical protein [Bacterioplanoides sp. SCSIO 12839]UTW49285.1 hypothetical protein KFF03_05110 [Bacterioplanoides sp. SCSIO 12839]